MDLEEEHYKTLLDNLCKFQQAGTFTDVALIINGDEFKAHRHILACHSPYFHAMFSANMLESTSPMIKISGVATHGFDLLLQYMYTGRLEITEDNVADVISTGIYLQVDPVVRKCVDFLTANISMDNLMDIMEIANTYHLDALRTKVFDLVSRQFTLRDDVAQNLDVELIQYVVSRDVPIVGSEIDMLRVVLSWFLSGTRNEIKQKEKSAKEILQHIHFEEISQKSFRSLLTEFFPTTCTQAEVLKDLLLAMYKSSQNNTAGVLVEDRQSSRGMKPAILRIGGFTGKGLTNEISYSFINDRHWRPLTSIPSVPQCNYGTAVLDNQLYIVGGCFDQLMLEVMHPDGLRYDPWSDTWELIAGMRVDRCRFTLTAMNNSLYAVGGATWHAATNTAECYDRTSNTWRTIESLPECRQQHAAVALECQDTNLLFVSGGLHKGTVIASMFMYNEKSNAWTSCAPLLAPRTDHTMFVYKNEVYVCGGWHTDPGVSIWCRQRRTQVPTIDVYNMQTNTWSHVTTVPRPRYHDGVVLHGSKLYLIGGFYRWNDFKKHTEVECYDFEEDTWSTDVKNDQDYWEHANALLKIPKY